MESALLGEIVKYGALGFIVFYTLKWLVKWGEENAKRSEMVMQNMMNRCDAERVVLTSRIQLIEDRQFASHNDILNAAVRALETNASAFERLANIETDKFPAIVPKNKDDT